MGPPLLNEKKDEGGHRMEKVVAICRRRRLYASIIAVDRCGFWFHQIFAAAAVFLQVSSPPQAQSQAQGGKRTMTLKNSTCSGGAQAHRRFQKAAPTASTCSRRRLCSDRSHRARGWWGRSMVKTVKKHGEDGEEQGEEGAF
ncbi:uncharacterized protein G2W53_036651 [Senna tora]|uniref:Uncharacterized protein n=1 Tax=Senna tora TaxID=362788 RepID=A0A834SUU3_9FABA|nr:uncharacterized protein G2W53_036651 [Senna tora]